MTPDDCERYLYGDRSKGEPTAEDLKRWLEEPTTEDKIVEYWSPRRISDREHAKRDVEGVIVLVVAVLFLLFLFLAASGARKPIDDGAEQLRRVNAEVERRQIRLDQTRRSR